MSEIWEGKPEEPEEKLEIGDKIKRVSKIRSWGLESPEHSEKKYKPRTLESDIKETRI